MSKKMTKDQASMTNDSQAYPMPEGVLVVFPDAIFSATKTGCADMLPWSWKLGDWSFATRSVPLSFLSV